MATTASSAHVSPRGSVPTGVEVPVARRRCRTDELRWRLIRDEPREGAENMALDHALAASLPEGEGVLRLYGWSRPTVSFGRNEPAAPIGGSREVALPAYVRRPTGGRAVLHDDELTYAVVAPLRAFGGLRAAYRQINEALASALASLGATVALAGEEVDWSGEEVDWAGGTASAARALRPDAGPCFQKPASGEIISRGRKLVGSAQARVEGALLQHGSILLGGGQAVLGSDSVTLSEIVGGVVREDVCEAVAVGLRGSFGGSWEPGGYAAREMEVAGRLASERYGRDSWTWQRRQEQI